MTNMSLHGPPAYRDRSANSLSVPPSDPRAWNSVGGSTSTTVPKIDGPICTICQVALAGPETSERSPVQVPASAIGVDGVGSVGADVPSPQLTVTTRAVAALRAMIEEDDAGTVGDTEPAAARAVPQPSFAVASDKVDARSTVLKNTP